jgi:hypothetical protein
MFNKGAFVGKKKFWRYQNAGYNDKNKAQLLLFVCDRKGLDGSPKMN